MTGFFDQTDELRTIHQWARARYAAPWAVFGAVLLRVAATTEPHIQLPGIIGDRASLNLMAAFVSQSGGGKGSSDKVARLAWPADIHEEGLGSGEGLADLFKQPKNDGEDRITRALVMVPEIDTLTGLAQRQGNTVLATLKAAVMGERLGSKGASAATSRIVTPHSYRMCLSVGAQPGHTGVIFDDATGGTPQRVLWFRTTDPDMPAGRIDDPAPLNTTLPLWRRTDGVVEIVYGPPEISTSIIDAHLARQRGETDALDGHAMLTRCKVAAVLAIMHHRTVVSELDWLLSAAVMAHSDNVRTWLVTESRKAERKKVRDRALARSYGDEVYDQHLLERIKTSILTKLTNDGEQSGSQLRKHLGKPEKRVLLDRAIDDLINAGTVHAAPAKQGGTRYQLATTGDQSGHPSPPAETRVTGMVTGDQKPPANPVTRDHVGHPQNPRSERVTALVTRDQKPPVRGACSACNLTTILEDSGRCEQCASPTHQIPETRTERPMRVGYNGNDQITSRYDDAYYQLVATLEDERSYDL